MTTMEKVDLAELGLNDGAAGKGALTAIPRTPPTYSNIELIAIELDQDSPGSPARRQNQRPGRGRID